MGSDYLSDVLTHVLNDHLIGSNGLHGEQAPLVDPAASKTKLLLTVLRGDEKRLIVTKVLKNRRKKNLKHEVV